MYNLIDILVLLALLGSGLMAGVLYAFSGFIMAALARIPSAEGIRAMQSINKTVLNPVFFSSFIGTAAISIILLVLALTGRLGEGTLWISLASSFYVIGTFIVTAAGNVPLNEKLDTMDPASGEDFWKLYLTRWTRLNHLRTLCALIATTLFAIGLTLN